MSKTLCNTGIFRTVLYPEPWHIQNQLYIQNAYSQPWYIENPDKLRTLAYSKSEAYSEPYQTSTMLRFEKTFYGYNYFHKLIMNTFMKLAVFSTPWDKYLEVVSPKVVILCKKLLHARRPRTMNFLYIYWYIQINWPICS